mgnify:CR=1 FL=1
MVKAKTVYVCSNCGADSPKWIGKCPSCGEWNTYVEEIVVKEPVGKRALYGVSDGGKVRRDITSEEETRVDLGDRELNRVLGGGLVKGSLVLIGGEPGIGKSTLVLQTVLGLKGLRTLYVSGEESSRQLKLRADRIAHENPDCFILCETNLEQIFVQTKNVQPDLLIIDSIQTIYTEVVESSPGSPILVSESEFFDKLKPEIKSISGFFLSNLVIIEPTTDESPLSDNERYASFVNFTIF